MQIYDKIQYFQHLCNETRFQLATMSAYHLLGVLREKQKSFDRNHANSDHILPILDMKESINYHISVQGHTLGIPTHIHQEDQAILLQFGHIYRLTLYSISPTGHISPIILTPTALPTASSLQPPHIISTPMSIRIPKTVIK